MVMFLAITAILIAFATLLYTASLARKVEENPVERVANSVERLSKALYSNDETTDVLRTELTKLTERVSALEDVSTTNTAKAPPAAAPAPKSPSAPVVAKAPTEPKSKSTD